MFINESETCHHYYQKFMCNHCTPHLIQNWNFPSRLYVKNASEMYLKCLSENIAEGRFPFSKLFSNLVEDLLHEVLVMIANDVKVCHEKSVTELRPVEVLIIWQVLCIHILSLLIQTLTQPCAFICTYIISHKYWSFLINFEVFVDFGHHYSLIIIAMTKALHSLYWLNMNFYKLGRNIILESNSVLNLLGMFKVYPWWIYFQH